MKTIAIIQARLGSTRLPGKVLRDIGGKTMIERVVERIERCEKIDDIVIATTKELADRPLVEFCQNKRWNVFAGSEHDVLSRYVGAAEAFKADQIVRITSDCPLIEPTIVNKTVHLLSTVMGIDYASNFHPQRRFPRGLDCEIITREALGRIDRLAQDPHYREHVTLFAYRNASQFTIASVNSENDWSHLRWTVDTSEDLELVDSIYRHFGEQEFNWKDILAAYPTHPRWLTINQHCTQKVA
jgi:spore coat polysaccharide biosynthesis protein SpsF